MVRSRTGAHTRENQQAAGADLEIMTVTEDAGLRGEDLKKSRIGGGEVGRQLDSMIGRQKGDNDVRRLTAPSTAVG